MGARLILGALGFLAGVTAGGRAMAAPPDPVALETALDKVLAERVEDGDVLYGALKADPGPLDRWLEKVAGISWLDVRKWDRNHQIAFYLNAYNGNVLRIVRDHYPIHGDRPEYPANSIQQIPDVWNLPVRVGQQDLSLDRIEKDILLGDYREFRAHFALVCAAAGCPDLKNAAFHGATLSRELNLAAQIFIRSPKGSRIDREAKVVWLSPIFDWYRKDFSGRKGSPSILTENFDELGGALGYVASQLPWDDAKFIRTGDFHLRFFAYDWSLNERPPAR